MRKLLIAMAALAFSSAAVAGPSWTYVGAGLLVLDSDTDDVEGIDLEGSFGIGIFHIGAEIAAISDAPVSDTADGDDDLLFYRVSAGIHPAVTDSTDAVLEIGYAATDADDGDIEPSTLDLRFGVRSMISDQFEVNAFVITGFTDTDIPGGDDVTDTRLQIGGQYFFTDRISFNVRGSEDDVLVGGRFSF